jgi:hypothetical protein
MLRFSTALLVMLLAGCAANTSSGGARPRAECLVCKHNADLGCVNITVDEHTPQLAHQGKTYYFCSDECRDAFARNPDKYTR